LNFAECDYINVRLYKFFRSDRIDFVSNFPASKLSECAFKNWCLITSRHPNVQKLSKLHWKLKFCSLLSWFWKWMLVGRYHHLWFFPGVTILSSWLVCKSYTSSLDFRSSLDFESSLDFQFNFYFYSLQNYFELSKLINRIFRM
jgi:hypothetical protein